MKRNKQDKRRFIAGAIAIFLAFLMVLSVVAPLLTYGAQSSNVSISAEIGYSGLYKVGYPTQAVIEIENNSGPVSGEVLIRVPTVDSYSSEILSYTDYAYPVELLSNSSKQIKMDINISSIVKTGDLKVELIDSKGAALAESVINCTAVNPENIMIAALSDNHNGLASMRSVLVKYYMSGYSGATQTLTKLDGDNFPVTDAALSAFSIIVINDFDTSRLAEVSVEALKSWVLAGGTLFVGTGENYNKVMKGLESLLDVQKIKTVTTDNLEEIFEISDSVFYPLNEGDDTVSAIPNSDEISAKSPIVFEYIILNQYQSNNMDLYKSMASGSGKIVVCAFDFANSAVAQSLRFNEFFSNMISLEATYLDIKNKVNYYYDSSYIMHPYNMATIPSFDEGTMGLIYIFIALYIIIIGPVLYIVLKKRDKREWGFFAIPAFAFGITLLIFFVSLGSQYKNPIVNEISKVNVNHGSSVGVKNSNIVALYGKSGDIEVSVLKSLASINPFLNSNYGYYYGSYGNTSKGKKIISGNEPAIVYYDTERWGSNIFGLKEDVDLGGSIDADITLVNGVYQGVITNNTSFTLYDAIVSFGSLGCYNFGTLLPGESIVLDESDLSYRESLTTDYSLLIWEDTYYWNSNLMSTLSNSERWHKRYRIDLLNYNSNGNYYKGYYNYSYESRDNIDIEFTAFTTESMGNGEIIINGKNPINLYNNMITMKVECQENIDANYDLPFGYITPREVVSPEGSYEYNQNWGFYVYNTTELEFIYDLSKYKNIELFQFNEAMQMNDYSQTVVAEIYNYSSEEWENLNFSEYKFTANYINFGILRIRIDCKAIDHTYMPEIRIKGGR